MKHNDGANNGTDVEDNGEEEELSEEWDADRIGRKEVGNDELEEDDEGKQQGHSNGDLLPIVNRKIEDGHVEEGDEDAGNDEVDYVEEWLASYDDRVESLGFLAALQTVEDGDLCITLCFQKRRELLGEGYNVY